MRLRLRTSGSSTYRRYRRCAEGADADGPPEADAPRRQRDGGEVEDAGPVVLAGGLVERADEEHQEQGGNQPSEGARVRGTGLRCQGWLQLGCRCWVPSGLRPLRSASGHA